MENLISYLYTIEDDYFFSRAVEIACKHKDATVTVYPGDHTLVITPLTDDCKVLQGMSDFLKGFTYPIGKTEVIESFEEDVNELIAKPYHDVWELKSALVNALAESDSEITGLKRELDAVNEDLRFAYKTNVDLKARLDAMTESYKDVKAKYDKHLGSVDALKTILNSIV